MENRKYWIDELLDQMPLEEKNKLIKNFAELCNQEKEPDEYQKVLNDKFWYLIENDNYLSGSE